MVGETAAFLRANGMISFTVEENRVRFEVSVAPAERAELRSSPKLLNLTEAVQPRIFRA